MKETESWLEFMDRAKSNGLSPTLQEKVDRDKASASEHIENENICNSTRGVHTGLSTTDLE